MKHFNQLTPAELERLSLLMEEMGEALQVVGKIMRHGYESYNPDDKEKTSNRFLLVKELGDVRAALEIMYECGDVSSGDIQADCFKKRKKVGKYLHHNHVTEHEAYEI